MSGDVTYQALRRLSWIPGRAQLSNGEVIAGQEYYDVLFTGGDISGVSIHDLESPLTIIDGGTGAATAQQARNNLLPSQSTHSGEFLTTNGTNVSWAAVPGGGITQLTGDVTAGPGSGSQAATLATVNSNVGSFGTATDIPAFTVNGKGLITAASTNAVTAPAGTLTGSTLAAGVTSSSLTSFGNSPTLVTPNIGTPSAGNLSNCTALPLGAITGLGTNVSTFLATPTSANLASALTDETGTGAAVFADSPALSGVPTAPTAAGGTNTTQLATTQFVGSAISTAVTALTSVVQQVSSFVSAVATGSTGTPFDDSIPQNTDGDQFMSASITPTNAANKIRVDVCWNGSSASADATTVALFQDSIADALAAVGYESDAGASLFCAQFSYIMTAGTTSPITFKVRAGANASVVTFNGQSAARLYGGVMASSIIITEYKL